MIKGLQASTLRWSDQGGAPREVAEGKVLVRKGDPPSKEGGAL